VTGFPHLSGELRCSVECGDCISRRTLPHRATSETSRYPLLPYQSPDACL